jgi:2,3-bisphosphoglycerate-dependent phosphoglycerate mutase
LRAFVKYLEDLSEEEIVHCNIPTGIPLVYDLDAQLRPLGREYLADAEQLSSAITEVQQQSAARPNKTP